MCTWFSGNRNRSAGFRLRRTGTSLFCYWHTVCGIQYATYINSFILSHSNLKRHFYFGSPIVWAPFLIKISMNATSSRLIEILHVTRWLAVETFRAIIHVPVLMDIKVIFFLFCFLFTSQVGVLTRVFVLGNGFYCIDVNECYQRDTCPDSVSSCVNSEGSFQCECIDGYAKGKVIRELN